MKRSLDISIDPSPAAMCSLPSYGTRKVSPRRRRRERRPALSTALQIADSGAQALSSTSMRPDPPGEACSSVRKRSPSLVHCQQGPHRKRAAWMTIHMFTAARPKQRSDELRSFVMLLAVICADHNEAQCAPATAVSIAHETTRKAEVCESGCAAIEGWPAMTSQ